MCWNHVLLVQIPNFWRLLVRYKITMVHLMRVTLDHSGKLGLLIRLVKDLIASWCVKKCGWRLHSVKRDFLWQICITDRLKLLSDFAKLKFFSFGLKMKRSIQTTNNIRNGKTIHVSDPSRGQLQYRFNTKKLVLHFYKFILSYFSKLPPRFRLHLQMIRYGLYIFFCASISKPCFQALMTLCHAKNVDPFSGHGIISGFLSTPQKRKLIGNE